MLTITDDYVVYSLEHEGDLSIDEDPVSFRQAMESNNSERWFDAMCRNRDHDGGDDLKMIIKMSLKI